VGAPEAAAHSPAGAAAKRRPIKLSAFSVAAAAAPLRPNLHPAPLGSICPIVVAAASVSPPPPPPSSSWPEVALSALTMR